MDPTKPILGIFQLIKICITTAIITIAAQGRDRQDSLQSEPQSNRSIINKAGKSHRTTLTNKYHTQN